jgi:signal transduction histidine kinase
MRERAAAYGGEVEAGRNGSGGFRVAATFPLLPE